uniref:Uncharacterized protein n=1 Tax=Chrysotila carterae TaxID=13221 RepID=A0A7S4BMU5_CHRCT
MALTVSLLNQNDVSNSIEQAAWHVREQRASTGVERSKRVTGAVQAAEEIKLGARSSFETAVSSASAVGGLVDSERRALQLWGSAIDASVAQLTNARAEAATLAAPLTEAQAAVRKAVEQVATGARASVASMRDDPTAASAFFAEGYLETLQAAVRDGERIAAASEEYSRSMRALAQLQTAMLDAKRTVADASDLWLGALNIKEETKTVLEGSSSLPVSPIALRSIENAERAATKAETATIRASAALDKLSSRANDAVVAATKSKTLLANLNAETSAAQAGLTNFPIGALDAAIAYASDVERALTSAKGAVPLEHQAVREAWHTARVELTKANSQRLKAKALLRSATADATQELTELDWIMPRRNEVIERLPKTQWVDRGRQYSQKYATEFSVADSQKVEKPPAASPLALPEPAELLKQAQDVVQRLQDARLQQSVSSVVLKSAEVAEATQQQAEAAAAAAETAIAAASTMDAPTTTSVPTTSAPTATAPTAEDPLTNDAPLTNLFRSAFSAPPAIVAAPSAPISAPEETDAAPAIEIRSSPMRDDGAVPNTPQSALSLSPSSSSSSSSSSSASPSVFSNSEQEDEAEARVLGMALSDVQTMATVYLSAVAAFLGADAMNNNTLQRALATDSTDASATNSATNTATDSATNSATNTAADSTSGAGIPWLRALSSSSQTDVLDAVSNATAQLSPNLENIKSQAEALRAQLAFTTSEVATSVGKAAAQLPKASPSTAHSDMAHKVDELTSTLKAPASSSSSSSSRYSQHNGASASEGTLEASRDVSCTSSSVTSSTSSCHSTTSVSSRLSRASTQCGEMLAPVLSLASDVGAGDSQRRRSPPRFWRRTQQPAFSDDGEPSCAPALSSKGKGTAERPSH